MNEVKKAKLAEDFKPILIDEVGCQLVGLLMFAGALVWRPVLCGCLLWQEAAITLRRTTTPLRLLWLGFVLNGWARNNGSPQ